MRSVPNIRWMTRGVLLMFSLGLGIRVLVGNVVPDGIFRVEREMGRISPWIREFWPPRYVYPPEQGADGSKEQRIAVSPVTIRVRTPRHFSSVEVVLEASGIPEESTVGVEHVLHRQDYLSRVLIDGRAVLPLQEVQQRRRDLQFKFTFPGLERGQPVRVRSILFFFHR